MNRKIYLLIDYRGHFYLSTRNKNNASLQIDSLRDFFLQASYDLIIMNFSEIDFRTQNFQGEYVLYQSSEDRDLFYKDYIEDILLGLQLQGAILIPNFYQFKAHNNKAFMEILRDVSSLSNIKNIRSKIFGTYEDFEKYFNTLPKTLVMKPAAGAMSTDVKVLSTNKEKISHAKKISNSFNLIDAVKFFLKQFILENYVKESLHRHKFIVQNFIPGLQYDYKILIYQKKYYLLQRNNRKNDFRASGSGLFQWIENLPDGLLDYAETIFIEFDCPFISLDIAYLDGEFYLFEFQFLRFGQYTIEKSAYYFQKINDKWEKISETPNVERELANSVIAFVESHASKFQSPITTNTKNEHKY